MTAPLTYLDNNATTALASPVRDAMLPWLDGLCANPSAGYAAGMAVKAAVGTARAAVARLIGGRAADLVFTASGTEANHLALLGALKARPDRRGLVLSAVEHPSVLMLARALAAEGRPVSEIPVDGDGRLDLAALDRAVSDDTALVSIMAANNETGVIMPLAEAGAIARRAGAGFHVDAVQAAGRIPLDVAALQIDYLSLSAHKLHGPKGIGALYVRKGAPLAPLIYGHQERHRRGGTENVPAIIGFAAAADLAGDFPAAAVAARRDRLEQGLQAALPGIRINGAGADRLPNTSNLRFHDAAGRPLDAEALLTRLDRAGVAVSLGAACATGAMEPSHVLLAMGLSAAEAAASLRLSLSRYTTDADIDRVLDVLPPLAERLAA